jgi:ABC-type multidrug transport system permease subunit
LPNWAQALSWLSPLRYANDAIQEIIVPNGDTSAMVISMVILFLYAVILLIVASRTLRDTA